MKSVGIIPARYGSSRFEGKPFGGPSRQADGAACYESACRAERLDAVIVATDDQRIYDAVTRFGGNVEMTGGVRNGYGTRCCRRRTVAL